MILYRSTAFNHRIILFCHSNRTATAGTIPITLKIEYLTADGCSHHLQNEHGEDRNRAHQAHDSHKNCENPSESRRTIDCFFIDSIQFNYTIDQSVYNDWPVNGHFFVQSQLFIFWMLSDIDGCVNDIHDNRRKR